MTEKVYTTITLMNEGYNPLIRELWEKFRKDEEYSGCRVLSIETSDFYCPIDKQPEEPKTILEKFYPKLSLATGITLNGKFSSTYINVYDLASIKEGGPVCKCGFRGKDEFYLYENHINSATSYNEETGQISIFYYGNLVGVELY